MTIETATFAVQRGDTQFSCLGSELGAKLLDDDLLIAQRGGNHGSIVKGSIQDTDLFVVTDGDNGHKSVTGAQVKGLFAKPKTPWSEWLNGEGTNYCYLEVIVTEEDACIVEDIRKLWDADTKQEIAVVRNRKKAVKKARKNAPENDRMKKHIKAYKQSEEFLALSEEEKSARLENLGFSSYYYYYYDDEEPLPIGRYIIGGRKPSFKSSEGDFELGPDSDFTKVESFLYYADSAFSGASSFSNKGKPLPNWDMSNIHPRGLNHLFKDTLINDDLSHWCIPLHTAAGSVGTGQLGTDPVWGTCNGAAASPPRDQFIEQVWNTITYIGLQEWQNKDDYAYPGWELAGPPGSPPTRPNCLFVKSSHNKGIGTHADWSFISNDMPVGSYVKVKGIVYKVTECGDASTWGDKWGSQHWWYVQLSGFDGYEDPDFWRIINSGSYEHWQTSMSFYVDAWRGTSSAWKE
jgi:hypothetical protein